MSDFDRQVIVYVRDADDNLVPGATIKWTEDGKDRGRIDNSDGHGTLTIRDPNSIVDVTVEYNGRSETRRLAREQKDGTTKVPDPWANPSTRTFMGQPFPA